MASDRAPHGLSSPRRPLPRPSSQRPEEQPRALCDVGPHVRALGGLRRQDLSSALCTCAKQPDSTVGFRGVQICNKHSSRGFINRHKIQCTVHRHSPVSIEPHGCVQTCTSWRRSSSRGGIGGRHACACGPRRAMCPRYQKEMTHRLRMMPAPAAAE